MAQEQKYGHREPEFRNDIDNDDDDRITETVLLEIVETGYRYQDALIEA